VLVASLLALAAGPASGGINASFVVDKMLVGTAPAGTTFTATISCSTSSETPSTIVYDNQGNPMVTADNPTGTDVVSVFVNTADTCTATETASGGAGNLAYRCTPGTSSCGASPNMINVIASGSSNGTIDIINTFLPPLTVSPSPAADGQMVTISGTLCTKKVFGGSVGTGGPVQVTVGYPSPVSATTTAAGGTGNWSVQVTVPAGTPPGSYAVTATCSDPVPYPVATSAVAGVTAAFTG
jgi:hypothetical protein